MTRPMHATSLPLLLVVVVVALLAAAEAAAQGTCTKSSPCPDSSYCCSRFGYCGKSNAYCGPDCVNGPCYDPSTPTPPSSPGGDDTPTPPSSPAGGDGWSSFFTQSDFNNWFPSRNGLYTFQGFSDATSAYSAFGTSGSTDAQKREIAAFFGNVKLESGGLQYTREIDPPTNFCDQTSTYNCVEGKSYYGRGALQITWNYNYGECGNALNLDLLADPDQVAQDGVTAFKTALWYWMTRNCHDAILNKSFAETIRIINGGIECGKGFNQNMENRVSYYVDFCQKLQVDPGTDLTC